ncbi:hypothetical protein GCM10020366_04780 [Saccharopolyspora gregorii]|uniref:Uncharacterized protein n=1 Tax=Saccharopolyspora gregorii TaxID=33914 RepID=A0ABP6RHU1_9PSEU
MLLLGRKNGGVRRFLLPYDTRTPPFCEAEGDAVTGAQRSDARRNHARILAVAEQEVAARGAEASLEQIAPPPESDRRPCAGTSHPRARSKRSRTAASTR